MWHQAPAQRPLFRVLAQLAWLPDCREQLDRAQRSGKESRERCCALTQELEAAKAQVDELRDRHGEAEQGLAPSLRMSKRVWAAH